MLSFLRSENYVVGMFELGFGTEFVFMGLTWAECNQYRDSNKKFCLVSVTAKHTNVRPIYTSITFYVI